MYNQTTEASIGSSSYLFKQLRRTKYENKEEMATFQPITSVDAKRIGLFSIYEPIFWEDSRCNHRITGASRASEVSSGEKLDWEEYVWTPTSHWQMPWKALLVFAFVTTAQARSVGNHWNFTTALFPSCFLCSSAVKEGRLFSRPLEIDCT